MVKHYSAKDVSVIVGTRALKGFGPDSKVTVIRTNDSFTVQDGVDGEATRSQQNSRIGQITIPLMQSSDDNEYMSELAIRDETSGDGVVPVTIKDKNGTTVHSSPAAWIRKPPDNAFNRDADVREWVLDCAELKMFTGKSISKGG